MNVRLARFAPTDSALAGWGGLIGVACTTASAPLMPIWGFPPSGSSGRTIANFIAAHHSGLTSGMLLNILGVTLWALLGAGVWQRMRGRGGPPTLAANCFGIGVTMLIALILAGFLAFVVLISRLNDPSVAPLLYDLTFGLLAISGAPTALCLAAFAADALRTKRFPAVAAWVAVVGAAAHVLLVFSIFIPRGFFSLQGQVITAAPATLFIWWVTVAVALVTSAGPAKTASLAG